MSLHSNLRQQRILKLLETKLQIGSGELQKELGCNAMTLWRDLNALAEQGLIDRVRGGARWKGQHTVETLFEEKLDHASTAKRDIARTAIKHFVKAKTAIAMEGGSTVAALVDELPNKGIEVVTNSLPIALRLRQGRSQIPVSVIGGTLSPTSGNTTGPDAIRDIQRQQSDICFLSATGWDSKSGPTDPNPMEIEAKRALVSISKKVVLLLDHSKFTTQSASVMLHPKRIHTIITDQKPPTRIINQLKAHNIKLIVTN